MADAAQLLALDARIGMQRHDMQQLAQRLLDLLVRDDSNPRDIAARLTVQPESTSVLDAPTDGSERVAARPPDFCVDHLQRPTCRHGRLASIPERCVIAVAHADARHCCTLVWRSVSSAIVGARTLADIRSVGTSGRARAHGRSARSPVSRRRADLCRAARRGSRLCSGA